MAPHPSPGEDKKRVSATARLIGSASSGFLELICFHPVDTVAKRLMSYQGKIYQPGQPFSQSISTLSTVIFKDKAQSSVMSRYISLFPGLGFAAGYKVLQRVYKFGGQPFVKDYLKNRHGETFNRVFGKKSARTWMEATAGSIVGIGEIVLLPLDVLKIKSQTNPETLRGRGFINMVMNDWRELYRGAGWTAARNAPGSFALFGGNSFAKQNIFGLSEHQKPTLFQTFVSSIIGSIASITISAPLDVVKTRIQNRPFDSPESGMQIIRNMIRNEGFGAFFKGLAPKVGIVGPKLIFSFTVAQTMIQYAHEKWD